MNDNEIRMNMIFSQKFLCVSDGRTKFVYDSTRHQGNEFIILIRIPRQPSCQNHKTSSSVCTKKKGNSNKVNATSCLKMST